MSDGAGRAALARVDGLDGAAPSVRTGALLLVPLAGTMAAVAIISLGPYFAWTSPLYFRLACGLLVALFGIAVGVGAIQVSRRDALLAGLTTLTLIYYASHPRGRLYDPSTGWAAILIFILLPEEYKRSSYRGFVWAFALSLVPAIIVWVLSAAGINVPWSYLYARRLDADYLLGNGGGYYRQYLGSVVRNNLFWTFSNGATIFRLHGLYEEPGVVGTIASLLLVGNRFRFRDHPENVILFIGGLLSFSLAFFLIVYLSCLLRRPALTITLTAALVSVGLLLDVADRIPLVKLLLLNRMAIQNGSLAGDNRVTPVFNAIYEQFLQGDLAAKLFGSGQDISAVVNTGAFSYKVLIFQYGFVGFAMLLGVLILGTLFIARGRDVMLLLVTVLLSVYQRPNVLSAPFLVILFGGAAWIAWEGCARPSRAVERISSA